MDLESAPDYVVGITTDTHVYERLDSGEWRSMTRQESAAACEDGRHGWRATGWAQHGTPLRIRELCSRPDCGASRTVVTAPYWMKHQKRDQQQRLT